MGSEESGGGGEGEEEFRSLGSWVKEEDKGIIVVHLPFFFVKKKRTRGFEWIKVGFTVHIEPPKIKQNGHMKLYNCLRYELWTNPSLYMSKKCEKYTNVNPRKQRKAPEKR